MSSRPEGSAKTLHLRTTLAADFDHPSRDRPYVLPDPTPVPGSPPAPAATAVPQPRPAPPPPAPPSAGGVEGIIIAAAARYGADAGQLLRVARCESGLDPSNYNGRSAYLEDLTTGLPKDDPTAAEAVAWGRAIGLFQFIPDTWRGNGGGDIWSAYDQADKAARMFSQGQAHQWVCK